MAINFDRLPTEKPANSTVVAPGFYKFEITKANMVKAYEAGNPDFLGLTLKLSTLDNKEAGYLNDKIVEDPKPAVGYKIARLMRAVDLGIEGSMELNDLCKLIVGAKGFVEVAHFTPEGKSPIAIVDLFSHDCYYKKNERAVVMALVDEAITQLPFEKENEDTVEESVVEDDDY